MGFDRELLYRSTKQDISEIEKRIKSISDSLAKNEGAIDVIGQQMSELVKFQEMKLEFEKIKKYIQAELDFDLESEATSRYTWLNQVKEIYKYLKS